MLLNGGGGVFLISMRCLIFWGSSRYCSGANHICVNEYGEHCQGRHQFEHTVKTLKFEKSGDA